MIYTSVILIILSIYVFVSLKYHVIKSDFRISDLNKIMDYETIISTYEIDPEYPVISRDLAEQYLIPKSFNELFKDIRFNYPMRSFLAYFIVMLFPYFHIFTVMMIAIYYIIHSKYEFYESPGNSKCTICILKSSDIIIKSISWIIKFLKDNLIEYYE